MNNDCARCGGKDGRHGDGCQQSRFYQILDEAAVRSELLAAVRFLDEYEATIALAYIKRLIKSRETR